MTTFALLHGGSHGGWCWERVTPLLERAGHRAVAPDLPIGDPEAGAEAWARTVIEAVDGDADLIVVGHSLGGVATPVVAAMAPVRRLVLLAAMVPMPGLALVDYLAGHPDAITFPIDRGIVDNDGMPGLSWEVCRDYFYPDCDEAVARAAWARLRSQALTVFVEPCPIDGWPAVPTTSIVMTGDRCVSPEWSRRVARDRLACEVIDLPGGHSPFLANPQALTDVLLELASRPDPA